MKFLILVIVIFLLFFGLEKLFKKLFNAKKVKFSDSPVKDIEQRGRIIILIAGLCSLPFAIGRDWMLGFWIVYLTLLHGFQAYMQWKFAKESRAHLVTLSLIPIVIAAFLAIAFIL